MPRGEALRELYHRLFDLPNVIGCYVGEKTVRGVGTGRPAVIACVAEKIPIRQLRRPMRIPRSVLWAPRANLRVPLETDVQTFASTGLAAAPVAGPGDVAKGKGPCTIGVVMSHPSYGVVITTAGHGFEGSPGKIRIYPADQRPRVRIRNVGGGPAGGVYDGRLIKTCITNDGDYALIEPEPGIATGNYFQDVYPINGAAEATELDLPQPCFVLRSSGQKDTVLRGIRGSLTMAGWPMNNLLLTDYAATAGDSGCCLVDRTYRALGLLIGFAILDGRRYSVFGSVMYPLTQEQSQLY